MAESRCFLCKKKFGWLDDKFGKVTILKSNIPIFDGFGEDDMICYKCFQSEEEKLHKEQILVEKVTIKIIIF